MIFEKELKKLGMKDKEAAIYLAALQLGPSSAQLIGREADVVRATTYVILEGLMGQGLVAKYKEGKKTFFVAEPPRQLLRLIEKEREEIDEKQKDFERLLPELQILTKAAGGRPSVRYFRGKEGLHLMRREIVTYSKPGDTIYNFTPGDHLIAVFPDNEETYYQQRSARGIMAKTIFTARSKSLKKLWLSEGHSKNTERRYVSPGNFPSTSGMTIYEDRIAIGTFVGKQMGVIIESKPMADMMRRLFELAWETANLEE